MQFETFIQQALAAGVSPDTLASDFSAALNKVQDNNKSKKEEKEKREKEEYLKKARAEVESALKQAKFPFEAVSAAAVLATSSFRPSWSLEELDILRKSVIPCATLGAVFCSSLINEEMVDEDFKESLGDLASKALDGFIKDALGFDIDFDIKDAYVKAILNGGI